MTESDICLSRTSGALWTENRLRRFLWEILADYPEMSVIATQWGEPDRATGLNLAEDLLGRYPNATGMYAS
jgi:ABC-type sugar transport system, periplasmic component